MLTKKIANDIVQETSLRLGRNINIMDIGGVIIAAKDTSRIGLIHEGAIEVLNSKNSLIICKEAENNWQVAQPGINLPIVFQNETIGVIGITGNPDEIKDLGALVKMTTELMIKQEFFANQTEWIQRTKDTIMNELLKSNPSYGDIQRGLNILQFDFNPPFLTVMIKIEERSISNQAFIQLIERNIGKSHCFASFTNINLLVITICGLENDLTEKLVDQIYIAVKKAKIIFRMAYSLPFYEIETFQQSYLDCEHTLKISNKDQDFISFANIEGRSLIYQLNDTLAKRFSKRVFKDKDNEIISNTLKVFFANHLNIQKAAEALYVHRNTLIYRLDKITEKTGYDPRHFDDALNLQIALWIVENKN